MDSIVNDAIVEASRAEIAFCKFLSANDTGETGGHQAGIYISKPAIPLIFDTPGERGSNKDRWVKFLWQNDFETDSRFIYYGQGTRNEYRITNFGRNFPYLKPAYTGALMVICKVSNENYRGFVLNTEEEIDEFLSAFDLSPTETNNIIHVAQDVHQPSEQEEIEEFIRNLTEEFPSSIQMSAAAREIYLRLGNREDIVRTNPDSLIIQWTDQEYRLFRAVEKARFLETVQHGFDTVDDFISIANQLLNRRKSRAGKGLEHHLAALFSGNDLLFEEQVKTEGNKRPDFIFPSGAAYRNSNYPTNKLVSLASKTTCKDRWRQVINEADRLRDEYKYLFTLQPGISSQQMEEMQAEKVLLVVPAPLIKEYPADKQGRIFTVKRFIDFIKEKEGI